MLQTHLTIGSCLVVCLLVVEVLEVGIESSLLGLWVLEKDGGDAVGLGGSLAVHGLVEGGIAVLVLPLQLNLSLTTHIDVCMCVELKRIRRRR